MRTEPSSRVFGSKLAKGLELVDKSEYIKLIFLSDIPFVNFGLPFKMFNLFWKF